MTTDRTNQELASTEQQTNDINLQDPDILIECLPFRESVKQHAVQSFDEIRKNLSRSVQQNELNPSFTIWSIALKDFIQCYGFYFVKADHVKLINFYFSILSIENLSYSHAEMCFDVLWKFLQCVFILLCVNFIEYMHRNVL